MTQAHEDWSCKIRSVMNNDFVKVAAAGHSTRHSSLWINTAKNEYARVLEFIIKGSSAKIVR